MLIREYQGIGISNSIINWYGCFVVGRVLQVCTVVGEGPPALTLCEKMVQLVRGDVVTSHGSKLPSSSKDQTEWRTAHHTMLNGEVGGSQKGLGEGPGVMDLQRCWGFPEQRYKGRV